MKKSNNKLKFFASVSCILLMSFATNAATLAQWDPTGGPLNVTADPATTVQIMASVVTPDLSASPLISVVEFNTSNTNALPQGRVVSSATPLLTRYVEFGVSSGFEYSPSSVEYSKRSYFTTGAQNASIRSSLDAYAADIDTIVIDASINQSLITFDLTSLGAITGAITFRVYFYNAVTNQTDWSDIDSTLRGGNGVVLTGTVTPRIIPALSQWSLMLLILSLLGFAYFRSYRKN